MVVTLSTWAEWALVTIAAFNILLFGALVIGLLFGIREFKKLRGQVQPVIDRVNPILEEVRPAVAKVAPMIENNVRPMLDNVRDMTHTARGVVTDLGARAKRVGETGEKTVKDVSEHVGRTSRVVSEGVGKPLIEVAAAITGIAKALSILRSGMSDRADKSGSKGRKSDS